jgi:hypothetical protein
MSSISPYRRGYVFGLSFLELGVRFREINELPQPEQKLVLSVPFFVQHRSS